MTIAGISDNGRYVVGTMQFPHGPAAFRWSEDNGLELIGTLLDGPTTAAAVSADGSTVVGQVGSSASTSPFVWRSSTGIVIIPKPPGATRATILGVNHDGSLGVGTAVVASRNQAFSWASGSGSRFFLSPLSPIASTATAICDDGSSIVGAVATSSSSYTYRKRGDDIESITYQGTPILLLANCTSMDGRYIAGHNYSDSLLWASDEADPLLACPNGFGPSYPYAVTDDGSTVYGFMTGPLDSMHAYIWQTGVGMSELRVYLESLGTHVSGWDFHSVNGVSADGTSIAGSGRYAGRNVGFVIRGLPSTRVPCVADYNGEGDSGDILDFLDFIADVSACEQHALPCGEFGNPDLNADTIVDILDFLDFMDAFATGGE